MTQDDNRPDEPVCIACGGNCSPACGWHPHGCVYGGFGRGYWIAVEGCELKHAPPDDDESEIAS